MSYQLMYGVFIDKAVRVYINLRNDVKENIEKVWILHYWDQSSAFGTL